MFVHFIQNINSVLERRRQMQEAIQSSDVSGVGGQHTADAINGGSVGLLRPLAGGRHQPQQSPLHSALANICVIIGFAAFAYTVKYVLRTIATE